MMEPRIQVLDGAMGTMLESLGYDVSGPMWGSDLLFSDPKAIGRVHEGYVAAGADIIETGTHARDTAEGIMRGAIQLTYDSATKSDGKNTETIEWASAPKDGPRQASSPIDGRDSVGGPHGPVSGRHARVALSLGPYGATLSPSQEYAGIYPPPFGPDPESHSDSSSGRGNTNAFPATSSGRKAEIQAEEALTKWHLDRLRIYAGDKEVWEQVEWIAFETVPLLYEIRAIRRAVGMLYGVLRERWGSGRDVVSVGTNRSQGEEEEDRVGEEPRGDREWWRKRFWISSAYPNGLHPQLVLPDAGAEAETDPGSGTALWTDMSRTQHVSSDAILQALLGPLDASIEHVESEQRRRIPRPDGIGINCTHPQYISRLADDFTRAMSIYSSSQSIDTIREDPPVFVLYPDGGAVYDTVTRTWTDRTTSPREWARSVVGVARRLEEAEIAGQEGEGAWKVWGGVIVGGCCKSGFEEIGHLRQELDEA